MSAAATARVAVDAVYETLGETVILIAASGATRAARALTHRTAATIERPRSVAEGRRLALRADDATFAAGGSIRLGDLSFAVRRLEPSDDPMALERVVDLAPEGTP